MATPKHVNRLSNAATSVLCYVAMFNVSSSVMILERKNKNVRQKFYMEGENEMPTKYPGWEGRTK